MKVRIAIFTVVMLMLITLPVSKVPLMEGGRRMEKMMQISTSTQPPKVYPRPFLGFVYGGVHSVAQFRDVLAHDPALAALYERAADAQDAIRDYVLSHVEER